MSPEAGFSMPLPMASPMQAAEYWYARRAYYRDRGGRKHHGLGKSRAVPGKALCHLFPGHVPEAPITPILHCWARMDSPGLAIVGR